MTHAKLRIQQQPCAETLWQQFALVGAVDIHAAEVLESLYILPAKATAELNFAKVEQINSMGLAQLLKLFDHLQKKDITIRVTSANQMVWLLFNKSGLARFLSPDTEAVPVLPEVAVEPPSLEILPQPSALLLEQRFSLVGIIDVKSVDILMPLYVLPPQCTVELDFAKVDRVNSMGLAQLLKLFEHWQKNSVKVHVVNVNRMITVLFKMTGLTRFLSEAPAPALAPTPKAASPKMPSEPVVVDNGLQISPSPSASALQQCFKLAGIVDVDAIQPLAPLYTLPPQCAVELNFALVSRVNSMGLAQLLKLFEHWQQQHITIRITDTNRMIGVLFKMTGLNRFLTDAPLPATSTLNQAASARVAHVAVDTLMDMPERRNNTTVVASHEKLNLWINAQSSQQMNGWYFFNTYLQRHLGREVHLELIHGAMGERRKKIEDMDIVFTKPFEATRLILQHQFKPLMRPLDQVDEVTLLVRADEPRLTLSAFEGGTVVTAAPDNFVYLLGRFLLEEDNASMADMRYLFSGHDIKALQMLLKGDADILFVLSDTYRGLSGLTRKNLRVIEQSDTAFAFHLFCVSPQHAELGAALTKVLLDMSLDSQGRQVLADLGIPGWAKPSHDECDMLFMLFNRYAAA